MCGGGGGGMTSTSWNGNSRGGGDLKQIALREWGGGGMDMFWIYAF